MDTLVTNISHAAKRILEGGLVAFPTETVYGLGANALSDDAVAKIFATKGRPHFNPLIVHVTSVSQAERYVQFSDAAKKLAQHFWPGSLTLVLPRREDCALSLLVSAGLDSVAIRMPAHPLAQELLKAVGVPLAAPSANRSGKVSPTKASHVLEEFGGSVPVLDGGACPVGIESTVVDMTGDVPVILRHGAVTKNMLEQVAAVVNESTGEGEYKSPGMLASHYAPNTPIRLNATSVQQGEALLAFGSAVPSGALAQQNLSTKGDLTEAAANLFSMLRVLDKSGAKAIAVMSIPEEGLGVAMNDRLRRAAAPR